MIKKILVTILFTTLLASCISIKEISSDSVSQQVFVTATLPPTKVNPPVATFVTPSPTETASPVATVQADCKDAAILLRDVTVQDDTHVNAGEKLTKTWEFQNTGTCTWKGYTVKFSNGDPMNAPLSTPVTDTVPNNKVQVSVELTAPTADGRYTDYFTLLNSNGEVVPIGTQQTFWVKFIVGNYVAAPANPIPILPATQSANCTRSGNAAYISELLSLINAARADIGVPPLPVNAQLSAFAQHHASDMAFNNFLSHDGTDGTFSERMMSYGIFGEILAIGTPQNAMEQWHRDEHWDFVTGSNYTQIGIGYAYNSCSDYGGYFTVDFQ